MTFAPISAQIDTQSDLTRHRQNQHRIPVMVAMMTVRAIVRVAVTIPVFTGFTHGVAVFMPGRTAGIVTGTGSRVIGTALADTHVVAMVAAETVAVELVTTITPVIILMIARISLGHVDDTAERQPGAENGGQTQLGHQTILAAAVLDVLTDRFHDEYLSFCEHLVRASPLTVRPVSARPSIVSAGLYLKA